MEQNDDKKWQILASEYLFRRPWLTVRRDHVRLPNGAEIPEYYVLEYPDWINVIAITRDGRFLLERQYRHGLQWTATSCAPAYANKAKRLCRQPSANYTKRLATAKAPGPRF